MPSRPTTGPPTERDRSEVPGASSAATRQLLVRLRGGAGNQLFQYAAARSLVPRDQVSPIRSTTAHQLSIESLLPGRLTFVQEPATTGDGSLRRFLQAERYAARVRRRVGWLRRRHVFSQRGAIELAYQPKPSNFVTPRLIDGYFQHPSWLTPGAGLVVDELLDSAPAGFGDLLRRPPFAVLCVRRGDYEGLGITLDDSYYAAGLQTLDPQLPVAVVGDDPRFQTALAQRAQQLGRSTMQPTAVNDDPVVNDFWIIAAASAVVMANSTFCWWATTVGDHCHAQLGRQRTVVFPSRWIDGHGTRLRADAWTACDQEPTVS